MQSYEGEFLLATVYDKEYYYELTDNHYISLYPKCISSTVYCGIWIL